MRENQWKKLIFMLEQILKDETCGVLRRFKEQNII
jgi:hypothetical protein